MRFRTEGAWREVTTGRVRVGGAWKTLVRARAYIGGAWKDIATFTLPLTVTPSPSSAVANRIGAGTATTSAVTATPSGGLSPFTYAWARISGTGGTINSATSATTTFSRVMGEDEVATNVFRCTVSDSLGGTATADVTVDFISTPFDFS